MKSEMIEYKANVAQEDFQGVTFAASEKLSLTHVWEVISRTKSLPDGLDVDALYAGVRDKLRDPEREVRQHALRVLVDLIPVTKSLTLDNHMREILPEVLSNLRHSSPALRKSALDSLRKYLQHSMNYDRLLKDLITSTEDDCIIAALPYLIISKTKDETMDMVLSQLWKDVNNPYVNKEVAAKSLATIGYSLGEDKFKALMGTAKHNELQRIWDTFGITEHHDGKYRGKEFWNREDDRVILETEITLRTGPAITMKLHEECSPHSALKFMDDFDKDPSQMLRVINITEEERNSSFNEIIRRTPRKVRFGGESVKLRTPESDSSANERASVISITVSDAVSIETKRSLIPVRISSLPATPTKTFYSNKKRLHRSTPDLVSKSRYSRIPMKKDSNLTETVKISTEESRLVSQNPEDPAESHAKKNHISLTSNKVKKRSRNALDPSGTHNGIEVFHNLTRSPVRNNKPSTQVSEGSNKELNANIPNPIESTQSPEEEKKQKWQVAIYEPTDAPKADSKINNACEREEIPSKALEATQGKSEQKCDHIESDRDTREMSYNSFQVFLNERGGESMDDSNGSMRRDSEDNFEIIENDNSFLLYHNSMTGDSQIEERFLDDRSSRSKEDAFQNLWPPLPSRSEVAFAHLIEGWRAQELEQCLWRLVPDICRARAPSGISMAMMIMKRCSPRKLQDEILLRCFAHHLREGALQVLMAIARFLPSTEVEMSRITKFAAAALKDRRKRVRQAALETLATVASLNSNAVTLEIVNEVTRFSPDHQYLMNVVRARLSRRQLPTIEDDGTIRYSSPKEQTEYEWLLGEKIYCDSSPSSASSSHSMNYWTRNSRHVEDEKSTRVVSNGDENANGNQPVWAVDSSVLQRNSHAKDNRTNATVLQPVYILQPDARDHQYSRFGRGRSFSPPKQRRGAAASAGSASPRGIAPASIPQGYIESFRKSSSSDQLRPGRTRSRSRAVECSDRSSTSSTGSSTKSGAWQKEMRSGIPIPISSDTKLRFRSSNITANNTSAGPVIARIRNIESPRDDPVVTRLSLTDRKSASTETKNLNFPPSSGSESSGYFTPPYGTNEEAFVKLEDSRETAFDSDAGKEEVTESDSNNNSQEYVNSCEDEVDEPRESPMVYSKPRTPDSLTIENLSTDNPNDEEISKVPMVTNREDLCGNRSPFTFALNLPSQNTPPPRSEKSSPTIGNRRKSNSVVDLQSFLPVIPSRKNSAPLMREDIPSGHKFLIDTADEIPSPGKVSTKSSEPKSDFEELEPAKNLEEPAAPRKLSKRISRTSSRKSIKCTPRSVRGTTPVNIRSEPKEDLQLALAQLNNPEWEVMIQGLQSVANISRQYPDVVEAKMHNVCVNLGRHIKNLRSQVARAACRTVMEMLGSCRKGLDVELEEIAGPLLHRTADTNKFLRADANAALDFMCLQLPANRVISVLTARGCNHQNSVVRSTGIRLLADVVKRLGPERIFHLQKECRDKVFLAGAKSLVDGSLEARNYGKFMFSYLIGHQQFHKCLLEAVPQSTLRHVAKTLNSIKPFETNGC